MSKLIEITDVKDDEEDQDLRNLLEKYIKRSQELERKESKIMKQVELLQSAVSSLQDWSQSRKSSFDSSEIVHLDTNHIEKETKSIQEETIRIQEEVKMKIEENKKLQEEVNRRKQWRQLNEFFDDSKKKTETEVRETKASTENVSFIDSVKFFDEKLQKLKQVEKKLKEESKLRLEESKRKEKNEKDKLEILEWESMINKELIASFKKK